MKQNGQVPIWYPKKILYTAMSIMGLIVSMSMVVNSIRSARFITIMMKLAFIDKFRDFIH